MEDDLRNNMLNCAVRYAEARGFQLTTLGRKAAGDWRFFKLLEDGRPFTARKYDDVMSWFSANWPDTAPWPTGIPRPEAITCAA